MYGRHYIHKDFPELQHAQHESTTLFEFGCGVGNAFFPLLQELPYLQVIAFDMSKNAIDIIHVRPPTLGATGLTTRQANPEYDPVRCTAFVHDAAKDGTPAVCLNAYSMGADSGQFSGHAAHGVCRTVFARGVAAPLRNHSLH